MQYRRYSPPRLEEGESHCWKELALAPVPYHRDLLQGGLVGHLHHDRVRRKEGHSTALTSWMISSAILAAPL